MPFSGSLLALLFSISRTTCMVSLAVETQIPTILRGHAASWGFALYEQWLIDSSTEAKGHAASWGEMTENLLSRSNVFIFPRRTNQA